MIPKSMSRKTPSFGQLVSYMDSEKSDERYDLHHNCLSRGQYDIEQAFIDNSKLMRTRKNGNYLYHEILSISLEEGVSRSHAKDCLREIALQYIEKRSPRNMVYGCLHEDHKDHLHYHLMISANELGESKRLRLSKAQFDAIKRDLEADVLKQYPELKQKRINTASKEEKKISRKAADQKRRTGKLERQEEVRDVLRGAMEITASLEDFQTYLQQHNFKFYTRGKNYGVEVTHDTGKIVKYRFSTLGVHDEYESYLERLSRSDSPRNDDLKGAGASRQENMSTDTKAVFDNDTGDLNGEKDNKQKKAEETKAAEASEGAAKANAFQNEMKDIYEKKERKRANKANKNIKPKT